MADVIKDGEIVEEETVETEEVVEAEELKTEEVETEETEDEKTPEPWLATDDEPLADVNALTHIGIKNKLKGKISERDEEIEKLKAEVTALKSTPEPKVLKRPKEDDFETDEEYEAAKEQYEEAATRQRFDRIEFQKKQSEFQQKYKEIVDAAVNSHYERADKLIAKSGIKPDVYKKADENLRLAIDTILPQQGDTIVDQIISLVGEGSEKVLYFLGNNKAALNEFKSLWIDDKTGIKAAIYLGEQKQRLTNPNKRTTRAPSPSPNLKGDDVAGSNGTAMKKAYIKAHKSGKNQEAYNAKKAARAAGVDVSTW
jgi:hypothetical protein